MIDVQMVAGKRPEVLHEALHRLQTQSEAVSRILVANNTGSPLDINGEDLEIVDNEVPLTFEQNHNRLAALGSSPFILFLDDDSFLFDGAIDVLLNHIQAYRDVAVLGGMNNQSYPLRYQDRAIPTIGNLDDFRKHEADYETVARGLKENHRDQWFPRIFLPGNLLLVRRKVWQREYGGWDEAYRNWNEEVDFIAWCWQRGYRALATPSVWFYHCQGQSRTTQSLFDDILASSQHFVAKWSSEQLSALRDLFMRQGLQPLVEELDHLVRSNAQNSTESGLRANPYFQSMDSALTSR